MVVMVKEHTPGHEMLLRFTQLLLTLLESLPNQPLRLVLGPLRAEELPPLPSPTDCADPDTNESGPPVTVFLPWLFC